MNIVFYTSFNERSITLESTILYFLNKGDNVYLLTTCPRGAIHKELENYGVNCYSSIDGRSKTYFNNIYHILFLIRFCRKHKIDIIHSHLQLPNFYSVIANFFIKSKILTVRHNSDVIFLYGTPKERFLEKIINILSPCIIAISKKVKQQLIEIENVDERKIIQINNGYDFLKYQNLSLLEEYTKLKTKYAGNFVILSPGRLMSSKRHHICIEAMPELLKTYPNIQLIIIGNGLEKNNLELLIKTLNLEANVNLIDYQENITDYIKLADIVVQLSVSEASNNIIKEAAYFEKTCIACSGVGDFDDYMIDCESGFLLQKNNPKFEYIKCINKLTVNNKLYGQKLKKEVLNQFDIKKIGKDYENLHQNLFTKK